MYAIDMGLRKNKNFLVCLCDVSFVKTRKFLSSPVFHANIWSLYIDRSYKLFLVAHKCHEKNLSNEEMCLFETSIQNEPLFLVKQT